MKIRGFNDLQLKKSADVLLGVGQAVLIADLLAIFFPSVGNKVGFWGEVGGLILFVLCYWGAMLLLKEVKIG